ncbi:hypothetical protein C8R42DRAFT_724677 [Lentinula raphanica]|nr:hypothetical protein C8R42DRAFT_724677 [Lentinula raphanica]
MNPGEAVQIAPSQTLCITNVALFHESSDLGRTSLILSYMLSNGKASPPVTICTLMLGRTDQLSTDLRLLKGGKYLLQVQGPNPMSVIGFHDSAASFQVPTTAVPFRPSFGVSPGAEPHVTNRGTREAVGKQVEADGMRSDAVNRGTRAEADVMRAEPVLGTQTQPRPVGFQTQPRPVGLQTQPHGTQVQSDGMRSENSGIQDEVAVVEAAGTRLQAVGRQTHTIGTRAEAVQISSLNFPTPNNQHVPSQTNDAPEFAAPRSGYPKSTPLPFKNVLAPNPAVNPMAFQSTGTSTMFPFAPVLNTNSNVAHHNTAVGDPGSSIYDSMHAPKPTARQPVHAVNPTKRVLRFGGPFMPLAEVPETSNSDSAFNNPGNLNTAGSASTPMTLNKGKDKAIANNAQTIMRDDHETDAEDL